MVETLVSLGRMITSDRLLRAIAPFFDSEAEELNAVPGGVFFFLSIKEFFFFFFFSLINFISTLTDQKTKQNKTKQNKKQQKIQQQKNTTYNEKYLQYNATVQHLSTNYWL